MYSVSEAYIEQMMGRGIRRRLTGAIDSVPFSGSDVVADSFSVEMRASEESNTKIGGVFLGQLDITFVPSFLSKVARTEYYGKQISVSIGLLVTEEGEEPAWVDVPVGVYTLQAPKISKQGVSVSGYDNMQKLDKKFSIDQASATPYGYLSHMASSCDVTLGNTQEEIEALPNGTELLPLDENNDIETFRDLLYWLAQTLGCFACADRLGNIVLRKFGMSNDVEFDETHRDVDAIFSGYTTKWTGVSFVETATQMTRYYGLPVDDGLTMNMGANPLLQLGAAEAVERRRTAVLNAVADIQYVPFYCNSARDVIYDLGDEINFTGGISGTCKGCIMALTYTLDNCNFEGYGDDPALTNARSKTDKNIAGLMQNTVENELTFYNYTNLESIRIDYQEEVTVASLKFTSAQLTTVKILHELNMRMSVDENETMTGYEVNYYLDGDLIPYKPTEYTMKNGETNPFAINLVCRDFFYILKDVEPNVRHTWEVRLKTLGNTKIVMGAGSVHVTLEGQRLYGEEYWGGYIEVQDYLTIIPLGYLGLVSITDSALVYTGNTRAKGEAEDNITLYDVSSLSLLPMQEGTGDLSPHIFLRGGFYLITDNDDYLTTDDGYRLITD